MLSTYLITAMKKKSQKGFLTPEELKESAEKVWLAGLGALSAAQNESDKLFRKLVDRGKEFESRIKDEADDAKDKAEDMWEDLEKNLKGFVESAMKKVGIPVEEEIDKLGEHVDALTDRITRMANELAAEAAEAFDALREKAEKAAAQAKGEQEAAPKKPKAKKAKAKPKGKAKTKAKKAKKRKDSSKTIGKAKTKPKVTMTHIGGGWYEIKKGGRLVSKVRGKANAQAEMKAQGA